MTTTTSSAEQQLRSVSNLLQMLANDPSRRDLKQILRIAVQELEMLADRLPDESASPLEGEADPSRSSDLVGASNS